MTVTTAASTTPVETVTPIKPSEALRLGRLVRPRKCLAKAFDGEDGACAIGAIHVGWGGEPDLDDYFTTVARLSTLGIRGGPVRVIGMDIFDQAEREGQDGDAAVLAYLEARGL